MDKGKVWLVGAGPSDVGLMTLKAKSVLEGADVVMYDSLVGDAVLGLIPSGVKLINVGKRAGQDYMPQKDISKLLLDEALSGNKVVRLKGGDPFLFGRGGEELELLCEHGVPFEVVPGVTSAVSVPAYAGIPVTHRDFCSSVHIITGHLKDDDKPRFDYDALVRLNGTLVFLMGIGALEHICRGLLGSGMSTQMPAAVLEKGTTAKQRRVVATISTLPEEARRQGVKTPAIIVVGKVCSLAEKFHWAEDRPLGGARVLVTRPKELSSKLSEKLREQGAEVLEIPAIQTVQIENNEPLKDAIRRLKEYSWIVFTSQAGVSAFFKSLAESKMDIRSLGGLKFAAIGSATENAIAERGIFCDCVPSKYDSESLGKSLAETVKPGEKLLLPRAKIGTKELTEALSKAGILFDDIPVYDTVYKNEGLLKISEILDGGEVDYVAFTSASTVMGFAAAADGKDFSGITAVCIGEQTAKEAQRLGMKTVISNKITIDSLVEKITELHMQLKGQR